MALSKCTFFSKQLIRFSARKNFQLLTKSAVRGQHLYLPLNAVRCLSISPSVRVPERTDQRLSYQPSVRQSDFEAEEELEYEIDEDELETLRHEHREHARTQHKNKKELTFKDFDINKNLVARLESLGYKEPFLIQTETLKVTLGGRDVIAKSVTGSGKTLCFGIPIVNKLAESPREKSSRNPRAIVISPTRELCLQIHKCIQELNPKLKCVAVYGGEKKHIQEQKIMRGCDVVCATPGRLNDHWRSGLFDVNEVEFLCLDEADELLTPNFKMQIEDILDNVPREKQMMLFSATIPKNIRSLIHTYMSEPVEVDITKDQNYMPTSVQHKCIECEPKDTVPILVALLRQYKPERCIVFTETKAMTKSVTSDLRRCGGKAQFINSDLTQTRRENLMAAFRSGRLKILVATDVAARGLDIPEIDLIIQVKPPSNGSDNYVHRSGRTGRAGRDGVAIMLHNGSPAEKGLIREIEQLVTLEHCEAPDISFLDGLNFESFIRYGLDGRSAPKPRGRFSDRNPRSGSRFSGGSSSYDRYSRFGRNSSFDRDAEFDGHHRSNRDFQFDRNSRYDRDSRNSRFQRNSSYDDDF